MTKSLSLLAQYCLASRAIKQLNKQIVTGVFNIGRCYNAYCKLMWPQPLPFMAISLAVTSCMEVSVAMQDKCNPYALDRIIAT